MSSKRNSKSDFHPGGMKLGEAQARRLAGVSGVEASQLQGLTVAEVGDRFKYVIDPQLLFFRKVCGKVVKTDPASGIQYPVPYATVQVEDTDCSLLGYFPHGSPWAWHFPFFCHREVIATTRTDACGNFCVWVPRWDIDWVLRWRIERHCYPIVFQRPDLSAILRELQLIPWPPPKPEPGDPYRLTGIDRARIENALGAGAVRQLDLASASSAFGRSASAGVEALSAQVLDQRLAPPLSVELRHAASRASHAVREAEPAMAAARNHLAAKTQLSAEAFRGLDLRNYQGPFLRCVTEIVPEWVPFFDVPDITFRVLQDVNGDGVEEQIYGETYFQVRWDATSIGPVTLEASPIAKVGLPCVPGSIPCGNQPAIVLAGWMPVVPAGVPATDPFDPVGGYARLTNRPHLNPSFSAASVTPGAAPIYGTLALLGCNKTDPNATQYRIVYEYSSDEGASWSAQVPFLGLTWPLYRLDAGGHLETYYPHADASGWYSIALPPGPNPWMPEDVLIDWPTGSFADGKYRLVLQVGSGGVVSQSSVPVTFAADNSAPNAVLAASWGTSVATADANPIGGACPVVFRGAVPQDIYFKVKLQGSAKHLRSVTLSANDCGAGHFQLMSGSLSGGVQDAGNPLVCEYWHTNVGDTSDTITVIYRLPAGSAQGTYGFSGTVAGRAFNPSGGDGGQLLTPPWQYDPADVVIYPSMAFSVING